MLTKISSTLKKIAMAIGPEDDSHRSQIHLDIDALLMKKSPELTKEAERFFDERLREKKKFVREDHLFTHVEKMDPKREYKYWWNHQNEVPEKDRLPAGQDAPTRPYLFLRFQTKDVVTSAEAKEILSKYFSIEKLADMVKPHKGSYQSLLFEQAWGSGLFRKYPDHDTPIVRPIKEIEKELKDRYEKAGWDEVIVHIDRVGVGQLQRFNINMQLFSKKLSETSKNYYTDRK